MATTEVSNMADGDQTPGQARSLKRRPTALDLFAGAGGLTQGLRQSGFRVVGAVELNALAAETYRLNHRRVRMWNADIRKLDAHKAMSDLGLAPGELGLLAGCPPCQGFSHLRTLNRSRAVADERNDLVFDYLRFVAAFQPKAVLLENVPALADDVRMEQLIAGLTALGYPAEGGYAILNAANFGVPQRRQRLVLLVGRDGHFAVPTPQRRRTVRDAIGRLVSPGNSGDPIHDFPERRSQKVLDLIRKIPLDGGSRTDLDLSEQLECHTKTTGFRDVYGRMAWDKPAPTITTGCHNPSRGRFLHPTEHRAITMREAALLQTFPKGYKFSLKGGKEGVATMIGNAIPPQFVVAHTREAARVL
ncbi:DNA cytosine methyltransferase [Micromonospora chalcea]